MNRISTLAASSVTRK